MSRDHLGAADAAIRTELAAIFVSLELSRSQILVTSLSPGGGDRLSKHSVPAGKADDLLACLQRLVDKAAARTGVSYPVVAIQEAGLEGFWIHRLLCQAGIESHVVDAASVAVSRRRRRAKTDRIDGEALIRVLLAYKRGEPRVCAMVRAPTPAEEDRRRLTREREALIAERVRHVNRIKGLLFAQGIDGFEPLRRDRRQRLLALRTGDGRPLPPNLRAQIARALERLELLLTQIAAVEAERDTLLAAAERAWKEGGDTGAAAAPALLMRLRGIGAACAATLWTEGLGRRFDNRRQVAAYAGLAPTPWRSGAIEREQGVSKAGNPRLRTAMIQLAWLWLRHQPQSALARWFHVPRSTKRKAERKIRIVALARKLLVALWRYLHAGVVMDGAALKPAGQA
jgi:transposase